MAKRPREEETSTLSEAPPPPPSPEQRQDHALQTCGLRPGLGREMDYQAYARVFSLLAGGDHEMTISEARFVAWSRSCWGWDRYLATAAFRACDVDSSGYLNRHEFALVCAAIPDFCHRQHSSFAPLVELRLRVIFALYSQLDASGRRRLLLDLAAGPSHIAHLAGQLGWSLDTSSSPSSSISDSTDSDDSAPAPSLADFQALVSSGGLASLHLRTRDLLQTPPRKALPLVLEPRGLVAMGTGITGQVASVNLGLRQTSVPVGHQVSGRHSPKNIFKSFP